MHALIVLISYIAWYFYFYFYSFSLTFFFRVFFGGEGADECPTPHVSLRSPARVRQLLPPSRLGRRLHQKDEDAGALEFAGSAAPGSDAPSKKEVMIRRLSLGDPRDI